jgi:hypothetical protein
MVIPLKFVLLGVVTACLVLAVWIGLFHYRIGPNRPLEEPVLTSFPSTAMPEAERASFLVGDFTIIERMRALPPTILGNYTEINGNRLTMADPGQEFRAGDVVYDANVPSKRLIFAGIQSQKCFLHFERGGRGLSYVLIFFRLGAVNGTKPVWIGYCNRPAIDLTDLRSMILDNGCH